MSRKIYDVVKDGNLWVVRARGATRASATARTKAEIEQKAAAIARNNGYAQVVVHREDGTFEKEWTYGNDPVRTPG